MSYDTSRLADLVARFQDIPPATIGHYLEEGFMDTAIRPVWKPVKLVGPAFTLRMAPGDGTLVRPALDQIRPGEVLVIDQRGDTRRAPWGEMTSLGAKTAGCAGMIIDGSVTDIVEIEQQQMPTFSRAITAITTRRLEYGGAINEPIQCGGVLVNPGDLIVADDNGICVMSPDVAEGVYAVSRDAEDRAPHQRIWLTRGGGLSAMTGKGTQDLARLLEERGWL